MFKNIYVFYFKWKKKSCVDGGRLETRSRIMQKQAYTSPEDTLTAKVHGENLWGLIKVKILDLSWHIFRAKEKRIQKKGKKTLQSSKRLGHIQSGMNKRSGHWEEESSAIQI